MAHEESEKQIAVLYLVQRSGRISHHRIPLVHEVYTFGSGAHCDISIRRESVAHEHMRLRCVGPGSYAVENTWVRRKF
jgi:hypothetical protein